MRVLLVTPPMIDLSSPYPATAYLKGHLSKQGHEVLQADFALELALKLFSKHGLEAICSELEARGDGPANAISSGIGSFGAKFLLSNRSRYFDTVAPTIRFLQGKDPTLALRICSRLFLPEGPRFMVLGKPGSSSHGDPIYWAFGSLGTQDRAKYLATLYLADIADVIQHSIDPKFTLAAYGEKLASNIQDFDVLERALNDSNSLVDRYLDELTCDYMRRLEPAVVGITIPFPGNLYGAFRIARTIKRAFPQVRVVLGGGFVNTELRQLAEPKVFNYADFITLDDGEAPFSCLLQHLAGHRKPDNLFRTLVREEGTVCFKNDPTCRDIPHGQIGAPSYDGLSLGSYFSLNDTLNPVQRIWSDGRWNKLTLAHGCYWRKCTFCDVSLDYIARYEPAPVDSLVEHIQALIQETGSTGFHFVDEAAPPALLKALAEKLISSGIAITWWANIRFEKTFSPDLARLMAQSGCVAVTGGLEVASDRLLQLMKKGVTVEQVARVARGFSEAGILVHTYLMYGFPTQTEQETVDSLELVRQLFAARCIQSAFWHRFIATTSSPIGLNPREYGIQIVPLPPKNFVAYELQFTDPAQCDHDRLGEGLRRALVSYMQGAALDREVHLWFETDPTQHPIPRATVAADFIEKALQGMAPGSHSVVNKSRVEEESVCP
jgi:radical SAM superfamily enzyme YgiQ (UPF0313 family)